MKDNWGDEIYVHNGSACVYVVFTTRDGDDIDMALSPKKARKLAQRLTLAAQEIECSQRLEALKRD